MTTVRALSDWPHSVSEGGEVSAELVLRRAEPIDSERLVMQPPTDSPLRRRKAK
jgi:hypothetical protein